MCDKIASNSLQFSEYVGYNDLRSFVLVRKIRSYIDAPISSQAKSASLQRSEILFRGRREQRAVVSHNEKLQPKSYVRVYYEKKNFELSYAFISVVCFWMRRR